MYKVFFLPLPKRTSAAAAASSDLEGESRAPNLKRGSKTQVPMWQPNAARGASHHLL